MDFRAASLTIHSFTEPGGWEVSFHLLVYILRCELCCEIGSGTYQGVDLGTYWRTGKGSFLGVVVLGTISVLYLQALFDVTPFTYFKVQVDFLETSAQTLTEVCEFPGTYSRVHFGTGKRWQDSFNFLLQGLWLLVDAGGRRGLTDAGGVDWWWMY